MTLAGATGVRHVLVSELTLPVGDPLATLCIGGLHAGALPSMIKIPIHSALKTDEGLRHHFIFLSLASHTIERSDRPSEKSDTRLVKSPTRTSEKSQSAEQGLHDSLRQQELLSALGVTALRGVPPQDLLNEAVRVCAEGLQAELCKVLEFQARENRLLMKAGFGWHEGLVGVASVGADMTSPPGHALHTGKPVISNHLENEEWFGTSELLLVHGVHRAINVILQGDGTPYGVRVDSHSPGEFNEDDITFRQGAANILGMASERQRGSVANRPRLPQGSRERD